MIIKSYCITLDWWFTIRSDNTEEEDKPTTEEGEQMPSDKQEEQEGAVA